MIVVRRSPDGHRPSRCACHVRPVLITAGAGPVAGPDGPTPTGPLSTARVLVPAARGGRGTLVSALAAEQLAVLVVPAASLVEQVERGGVDLVLLHGETGSALDELAALRAASAVPVVVTLRQGMASMECFLLAGADDCVARGVGRGELAARIRAVLRRRGRPVAGEVLRVGPFTLDLGRHVFSSRGEPVHLPPKEFGLLELLVRRDGRVVGRQEALERVWGGSPCSPGSPGSDPTTVDVHVKRLRGKIEADPAAPRHLLTVRGLGYRLVE